MALCHEYRISLDEWGEWSDYAQAAALGWQRWEREQCPQGHHPALWDPLKGGDLLNLMRPGQPGCPACAVMEGEQQARENEPHRPGSYWAWMPVPESASAPHDPGDGADDDSGEADSPPKEEQQADDDAEGRRVLSGADPAHDEQADEQG